MMNSLATLICLHSSAPIRSRAAEEGDFQIPLWSIPLILIVLYVCVFSGLGAFGLTGPDEPRYAAIARAMSETHDWITPRLWGTPWFEKPVLYYWAAGIAMRIFGVGEFAARLPSALAALLAVFAVTWTALRSYGAGAAWYASLLLPTSVAIIGFSRAASPDMLFAGLLTAAMAIAYEMLQRPRPGPLLQIAFGIFLGAAVLAKGPAAVILAGGATLAWAVLSRQWHAPLRFLHPLIIGVFCVTALPWYVLCALRNPSFLHVFIWQHNFERYLTPVFEHRQPFWFFVPVFLVGTLPWLPLLFTGLGEAIRKKSFATHLDSPALFILCWSLFTLFFFSLSQSKLPGYVLPAFPPAIVLVAAHLARQVAKKTRTAKTVIASVGIVFPVVLAMGRAQLHRPHVFGIVSPGNLERGIGVILLTALAGGALVVALALYCHWNRAIGAVAGTVVVLLLVANHFILPALDLSISARPTATGLINSFSATSDDVAVFQLPRAYKYGLNYYFGKDLPEWRPEMRQRYLFFGEGSLHELERFPQLFNARTSSFFPATPNGKIYLLLNRAPIIFR